MAAAPLPSPRARRPRAVVALGASAGGLESLGRLLAGLPREFPAPILVVLHLDPHHPSQAVALLQARTQLRVRSAKGGAPLKAGTVYVAPPDRHLEVRAGKVRLTRAAPVHHSRPSIDRLFASVAAAFGPAAIVAVLSGSGSDGAAGIAAVKARGGLAVAESEATAAFPGMPAAAAGTGLLDAALPIGQVPAYLLRAAARRVPVSERQWLRMLAILEARTGARFSRYRSTTLHRRLQQRLAARGCRSMAAYLRILEADAAEAQRLHAAFLIKVSAFLRDPPSWKALALELARWPRDGRPVRAWSAGCATGEEAYTLALLLARTFGDGLGAWKVYATDLDEGALRAARAARYSPEQVAALPKADLARHFVRDGDAWRVGKALRARVVFGRHDLLRDPPLSGMDVLACRNVLMYFTPDEKQRTLDRLTQALDPAGILVLGRGEALGPVPGFERIGRTTLFRRAGVSRDVTGRKRASRAGPEAKGAALGDPLAHSTTVVAVAVDAKGRVLAWNLAAEAFFGVPAGEARGKPLAKAVGAKAARELRALPESGGGPVVLSGEGPAGARPLSVERLPAPPPAAALFVGTALPPPRPVRAPSRPAAHARRSPFEARFAAQQDLNEELQSRNEELETVNEELQSLNDELSTMEAQVRGLGEESRRANDFLRLLLDVSPDALVACDADDRVTFWSRAAVERFRLSPAQAVGGNLFELVPALDGPALRSASRKVRRAGRVQVEQDGTAYVLDPLPAGRRRGYLLRVRSPS